MRRKSMLFNRESQLNNNILKQRYRRWFQTRCLLENGMKKQIPDQFVNGEKKVFVNYDR